MAQLVGVPSRGQSVAGPIPGWNCTYLGCGFNPWYRHIREATDRCFFLTSVFLSLSSSKKEEGGGREEGEEKREEEKERKKKRRRRDTENAM